MAASICALHLSSTACYGSFQTAQSWFNLCCHSNIVHLLASKPKGSSSIRFFVKFPWEIVLSSGLDFVFYFVFVFLLPIKFWESLVCGDKKSGTIMGLFVLITYSVEKQPDSRSKIWVLSVILHVNCRCCENSLKLLYLCVEFIEPFVVL